MQVSVEGKMVEVSDGASCADALKEGLSGKRFKEMCIRDRFWAEEAAM